MYHVRMNEGERGVDTAALNTAMRRANMTSADLARATRISPATISLILSGKHQGTSAVYLAKMAGALNTSVDYLLGLSEDPSPRDLMLGELLLELTRVARRLPSRRQRDLLLVARAYLEDGEEKRADPKRLYGDIVSLIAEYGGEVDLDYLLDRLAQPPEDDSAPLLGKD